VRPNASSTGTLRAMLHDERNQEPPRRGCARKRGGEADSISQPATRLDLFEAHAALRLEVAPKRLELLHQFVPSAKSIGLLVHPAFPVVAEAQAKELESAAHALGLHLLLVNASNPIEIEDAFAALVSDRSDESSRASSV
jgi:putative ABC transport system substrate-binding protein